MTTQYELTTKLIQYGECLEGLSLNDRATLNALVAYTGSPKTNNKWTVRLTSEQIAKKTGMSAKSVKRSLLNLSEHNLLHYSSSAAKRAGFKVINVGLLNAKLDNYIRNPAEYKPVVVSRGEVAPTREVKEAITEEEFTTAMAQIEAYVKEAYSANYGAATTAEDDTINF